MGPVSPPPTLTPPPQQQQQQQQQRRWRHAHERVASFSRPSEVIRVPARPAAGAAAGAPPPSPFRKLLILPGNPGCSAFYAPFAEALSEELGGATEVVALSFHGHETTLERRAEKEGEEGEGEWEGEEKEGKKKEGKKSKGEARRPRRRPLDLDGQVEHAAAFLEKLLSEIETEEQEQEEKEAKEARKKWGGRGRKRDDDGLLSVAVVGHSIGGTVAALAVREVEERRRRRWGGEGVGAGAGREERPCLLCRRRRRRRCRRRCLPLLPLRRRSSPRRGPKSPPSAP